jgi:hypothetical protein
VVVGDILGKGSQTTLPLSKGRRVEFTKWSENGKVLELPEIKLEEWEADLAKFSLSGCDKRMVMRRDFEEVKKQKSNFLSTNTILKKELSYYGEKVVKPLKIFAPQHVENLSCRGGSRDSFYYEVPYLDPVSQRVEKFLIDGGWRKKEFAKLMNNPTSICLRVGEKVDFLIRSVV